MKEESRKLFFTFIVSAVLHTIFFMVLVFAPAHRIHKDFSPSVINVSMVALPGSEKAPAQGNIDNFVLEKKQPEPARTIKPEKPVKQLNKVAPETVPETGKEAPKTVSTAPRKIKKSLKKKTFKSSKVVKSAIERIKKDVDKSRPDPVADAISRLKDKVGKAESAGKQKSETGTNTASPSSGIPGGYGGGGGKGQIKDIYMAQIKYHIEKNWAFSKQLTHGQTDLITVVVIKIMKNGKIKEVWFEKKSGNDYFDDSARKAVIKSDPLPKLPEGFLRPYYDLGLIFTPSGLR
jgi:colicin import membrane protein